jgi:repressor LexA
MSKFGSTQSAVYRFIITFYQENNFPPTVREICAALGLKSTSTVHTHLKNLAEKGLFRLNPTKQRSITIVAQEYSNQTPSARRVPLVGRVAAGEPILAVENVQEYYVFSPAILRGASENEVFMLEVRGESMIDAGINDGDMIIVHSGIGAQNGDIVVARVRSDTATVKRLYLNADGTVRLQPENKTMQPIIVGRNEVEIIGKLIGLYRKY